MKYLVLLFSLLLATPSIAKQLAITFDDSPRSAEGYFDGPTRAKKLINELNKHNIKQVAFFSVANKLDKEGQQRLQTYNDAGHLIANHTFSHPDFNKMRLSDYQQNFVKAHDKLKGYSNFVNWFRFPYLREGDTPTKRDGFRQTLQQYNYFNAYITLNNYDWYIENLFQNALREKQRINYEALQNLYVDIMVEGIEYYDELAIKHLGRSPKHVLLAHEMDITAMYIGDLVEKLRAKGWQVITPKEAYEDAIADYQTENVFRYNPGRIGEVAKDNGQKKNLWHSSLSEKYIKAQFDQKVLGQHLLK